jgi:hypothetical protein
MTESEATMADQMSSVARSWSRATHAVGVRARTVCAKHSINLQSGGGKRADDHCPLFMLGVDEGVLVLTLHRSASHVSCEYHFASGDVVICGYKIKPTGDWVGPLAPGAQSRLMNDVDVVARDIADGWLMGVVPRL